MAKFLDGIRIPKRLVHPAPPEEGFNLIYSIQDVVYSLDSSGVPKILTNSNNPSNIVGDYPLFIQDTQPIESGKYLWIQTNINQNPDEFSFYFEDGL